MGEIVAIKNIITKLANFRNYPKYIRKINPISDIWGGIEVRHLLHLQHFNKHANEMRQKLQPYYEDYVSSVSKDDQAISLELAVFLAVLCDILKPKYIVDFGSGFSSFVLRFYMKNAINKPVVWSVDDSAEWLNKTNLFLIKHGVSNNNLVDWDSFIKQNKVKFDLILNDFSVMETRRQRFHEILSVVAHNGVVILDDMHKFDFAEYVRKSLREYSFKHYSLRLFTKDRFGRYSTILFRQRQHSIIH